MQVLDILHKLGYSNIRETGTHFTTRPLYRDSDNDSALAVNKLTGNWYDFVQKKGGSIFSLVALMKGLKTKDEVKQFLETDSLEVDTNIQHRYELEEVKKFDKELLVKLRREHTYWLNRNISPRTIETFNGGITFNGRMKNRYVFPILNMRDELIGFSGRILSDDLNVPKWKHIGAKFNWCYPVRWNYEYLEATGEAILVESIGDMLSLWDAGIRNTLVTFGLSVSPTIIERLLRLDIQRILIAFNNDCDHNMVGNEAAEDEKIKLIRYFDESQVSVAIPDFKDFGEMDNDKINLWRQKHQLKKS